MSEYHSIYTGPEVDDGITKALAAKATLDLTYDGVWDLDYGSDTGAVTGLALAFVPRRIQLTVEIPAGGLHIVANPVYGSFTNDGFSYELSDMPDGAGLYRLHYSLKGESDGGSSSSSS